MKTEELIKGALEKKFGKKCTKIEEEADGTVYHFEGRKRGVLIPYK